MNILELQKKVIEFRDARDWEQYHNPKDLAISLMLEATELLEVFQWKDPQEVEAIKSERISFTGKVAAQVLKIANSARIPVTGWIGSWLSGEESYQVSGQRQPRIGLISTPEDFLKWLRDLEISENILRRYNDDTIFRTEFDDEILDVIDELNAKELQLLAGKNVNRTMRLVTGKNSYHRADEKTLRDIVDAEIVVFGHTHTSVDGNFVSLSDAIKGKYCN
jgi:NTP pyrophosphatase (non-canonical NTP hydrolase)